MYFKSYTFKGGSWMPYYIFEGPDGVGKSTAIQNVATTLLSHRPDLDIIMTQLPGTTPIGKHIRRLVKNPESIDEQITDINPLTRQILYAADYASFIIDELLPNLKTNKLVLCDRCSAISSLVYGYADGVNIRDLWQIYNIIPKSIAQAVFVLNCDPELAQSRIEGNRDKDHFDSKPLEFKTKIHESYKDLSTGGSDIHNTIMALGITNCIVPVDSGDRPEKITAKIVTKILEDLQRDNNAN